MPGHDVEWEIPGAFRLAGKDAFRQGDGVVGRSLATEGAHAALAFGFEQHGLERIISITAAAHTATRRVMERAGLTYRGTRTWMNPDVLVVWYAIDRPVWLSRGR